MTLKKVISGDPLKIKAETFNAMIDAAEAYKQQGATASTQILNKQNDGFVFIKNNTSTDVPRFGVLGLGAPIITPTNNLAEWQNNFSFIGESPLLATHGHKIAITQEPIAAGKIGRAKIVDATPVKINIASATDQYATITDNSSAALTSNSSSGFQIIWSEGVGSAKWAMVNLSQWTNPPAAGGSNSFLARIVNANPISTIHRWRYTFFEVELTDATAQNYQTKPGGIVSTAAYNTIEFANGNTTILSLIINRAWGVDLAASGYPAGFTPRSVAMDTIVQMRTTIAADLSSVYIFEAFGAHDGTCL